MDLEFLNKLTEEEIIELIYYCISSKKDFEELKGVKINKVTLWNEVDRKDINGNRYVIIHSLVGSFKANDFYMSSENMVNPHLNTDFSSQLREFMTRKIGERYIKAFYDMQMQEAKIESERLTDYLNNARKKKKEEND